VRRRALARLRRENKTISTVSGGSTHNLHPVTTHASIHSLELAKNGLPLRTFTIWRLHRVRVQKFKRKIVGVTAPVEATASVIVRSSSGRSFRVFCGTLLLLHKRRRFDREDFRLAENRHKGLRLSHDNPRRRQHEINRKLLGSVGHRIVWRRYSWCSACSRARIRWGLSGV